MGKRGPKGAGGTCTSLEELLENTCANPAFYPWRVRCGGEERYCYARTKQDAIKKVMCDLAMATPCPVEDILAAGAKARRKT